ncbi:hypothetical protein PRZ48_003878 [Zasmidium cellare]|uniref:Uncharacterized protein n=1 Tax=Zasmidium cellare TaxID=395010 RepID=A0ABR0EYI3_ZASCE|nr:hypothetical protein PRZ48_003878 [Zasmidium cellare]
MNTNRPRNINDADLLLDANCPGEPQTQLTDMSYFLHRIRLAEICRDAVDKRTMGMTQSSQDHAEQVMAIDSDLEKLLLDLPPFFKLDNYLQHTVSSYGPNALIQAYMLNTLIHSQRCKLHLASLTSQQPGRHRSLESAKSIIRAELMLIRSDHPFVRIRLRLTGMLYSVFMASIVLLMDLCLNRETEIQQSDMAEAMGIIDDAKSSSVAAGRIYESMVQILARHGYKHRVQREGKFSTSGVDDGANRPSRTLADLTPSSMATASDTGPQMHVQSHMAESLMTSLDQTPQQPPNEQEENMFDGYLQQWDDLFTDLQSSSLF